jgi:hypothetical protein
MATTTRALVEKAFREWTTVSIAHWDARKAKAANRYALSQQLDDKTFALNAAQLAARNEFAAATGWRFSKKWFGLDALTPAVPCRIGAPTVPTLSPYGGVVDHPECWKLGRQPIAITVHSYATHEQIAGFAAALGLNVEILPFSWWNPDGCICAVFTGSTSDDCDVVLRSPEWTQCPQVIDYIGRNSEPAIPGLES